VLLNLYTGVCFKIYHYNGAQEQEFKVIRYLKKVYERCEKKGKDCQKSSRVMKYMASGYIPKDLAREMYESVYPNDPKKVNDALKNYQNEKFVPYVSMEYISGMDAVEYCMKHGSLDQRTAAQLMHSLLLSVQEVHSMGLIHRDIKPDNFMIFKNENGMNEVKLIDLGLSIPSDQCQIMSRVDGTKLYSAPEALEGYASTYSDMFSVGMSFYRLCGSPKDFSSDYMKLLVKMTESDPWRRGTVSDSLLALEDIMREYQQK